jgi:hypothetical protein
MCQVHCLKVGGNLVSFLAFRSLYVFLRLLVCFFRHREGLREIERERERERKAKVEGSCPMSTLHVCVCGVCVCV